DQYRRPRGVPPRGGPLRDRISPTRRARGGEGTGGRGADVRGPAPFGAGVARIRFLRDRLRSGIRRRLGRGPDLEPRGARDCWRDRDLPGLSDPGILPLDLWWADRRDRGGLAAQGAVAVPEVGLG